MAEMSLSVKEAVHQASHIYANDGINRCRSVLLTQRVYDEIESLQTSEHK